MKAGGFGLKMLKIGDFGKFDWKIQTVIEFAASLNLKKIATNC
jgi:hypothetical protein